MRNRPQQLVFAAAAACLLAGGCATFNKDQPYTETSGRRGWHPFTRAARGNPADQLEFAENLRTDGHARKAARQYYALMVHWPESAEAAQAQYQYAKIVDARGKYEKAFDEYQRLFERYTGLFPYDEVLNRQFEIAKWRMEKRKGRFLFLPGFAAPERAVPLFEKIIASGPQWEKAPEVQYLIGRASEHALEYEKAIAAYMTTQQRYPDSPFAEQAAFDSASCLMKMVKESPNNQLILDQAWAAVVLYLNAYPSGANRTAAQELRDNLFRRRAKLSYDRARYYDVVAKKPKAALLAYQDLLREFPRSDWTYFAQSRIDALSNTVENAHEE